MNDKILKILKANGLDKEQHIVRMSNQDLLRLKGIGKKAVQIIRQIYGPPLIGWPVEDQCEYLGIEYIKMKAKWDSQQFHNFNWYDDTTGRWLYPEDCVLNRYLEKGWKGVNGEGRFIMTILNLLTQNELSGYWSLDFFYLTESAYWSKDNLSHHEKRLNQRIPNFLASTEKDLIERFKYAINPTLKKDQYAGFVHRFHHARNWPITLIVDAYRAFGKEKLLEILKLLMKGGEQRRYGWPDLTLVKDNKVKFIEVKTTDRLGLNQIDLFEHILKPLKLDVTVVQLKPRLRFDINET